MKNLNQLVCVTLMLSCFQAYRSYIHAQNAPKPQSNQLNVMNGTDWNVTVRYTTPAGVVTTDSINPNSSKTIEVNQKDSVSYSLSKEKAQTGIHTVALASIQQGTLQITAEMIKDLIAPFIQPIVPVVSVTPVIATTTTPQPIK